MLFAAFRQRRRAKDVIFALLGGRRRYGIAMMAVYAIASRVAYVEATARVDVPRACRRFFRAVRRLRHCFFFHMLRLFEIRRPALRAFTMPICFTGCYAPAIRSVEEL